MKLFLLLLAAMVSCTSAVVHRVGVGHIRTSGGFSPTCTLDSVIDKLSVRQYNLQEWYSQLSNGALTLSSNVATDVFSLQLSADGNSCASWYSIMETAFRSAGGTGSYDSFVWVFPAGFSVAGCDLADPEGGSVFSQKGPCSGGCHQIMYGCPYLNSYYYAIGRSLGLERSHSASSQLDDYTCQMAGVLTFDGSHRRGFNAVKMVDIGLIVPTVSQASFSQFLSALYMYETDAPGAVKVIQLVGTSYFLSHRGMDEQTVDRNNNFGSNWVPIGAQRLNGVTFVHKRESDGSSSVFQAIADGETYIVPGTSFQVRQDWHTRAGAQISVSSTGALPSAVSEPGVLYPASGVTYWGTSYLDTAEQSSFSTRCYGGSSELNMCWIGDDLNSTSCMLMTVNVPRSATVTEAKLIFTSDHEQLQAGSGTTKVWIVIESTDNAQTLTGNLFTRAGGYIQRKARDLTGTWYQEDEVELDIIPHIQTIVGRPGWAAGNKVNICVNSQIQSQTLTRSAWSGIQCGLPGGRTECGPRLRVQYSDGGGGEPVPENCVSTWGTWGICSNDLNQCGAAGTQARNLVIISQPAHGGTACPTTTRETRSCTTKPCDPVPQDCVWHWSDWSACSGTCSSFGSRMRTVIVDIVPDVDGAQCPEVRVDEEVCSTAACDPVNCVMNWDDWSPCSGPCASIGSKTRVGSPLILPQFGGTPCPTSPQTTSCQTDVCNQDCTVLYGPFTACFGSCGGTGGYRQKVGTVQTVQLGNGAACPPLVVTELCTTEPCQPVNCAYSWSYGPCLGGPCGGSGSQTRTPVIQTPASGSGTPCPTASSVACTMAPCVGVPVVSFPQLQTVDKGIISGSVSNLLVRDGIFEQVTESTKQIKVLWQILVPAATSLELEATIGANSLGTQSLQLQWSFLQTEWQTAVSVASQSVQTYRVTLTSSDTAAQMVYLRIMNTDTSSNRNPLTTARLDYLAINAYVSSVVTPVSCFQGQAVATACSNSCGAGTQTWTRPTLQVAMNGGTPCNLASWSAACTDLIGCVTPCVVGSWSSYSTCDSTCGAGNRTRTRSIVVPPTNGATCPPLFEKLACTNGQCSGPDCIWGPWNEVGGCSAPGCGGTQQYVRSVAWAGSSTGIACPAPSSMVLPCNMQHCSGTSYTVRMSARLIQMENVYYQSWDAQAAQVTPGVSLVLSGRATDFMLELEIADGWWQLVREANSPNCAITKVELSCPGVDAIKGTSIIGGGLLGRVQCHETIGDLGSLAEAIFTVTC